MPVISFPPVEQADESGLLAIGGDMAIESLLLAYSRGIFPWPISDEYPLAWFSPDPRGIIRVDSLKIPKSLKKVIKKDCFYLEFNKNFLQVIIECAKGITRKKKEGTWITSELIQSYYHLHQAGHAFSVEVYEREGQSLVGGLYGAFIGDLFTGESMFFLESEASRLALCATVLMLKEKKVKWLDTQILGPASKSVGGEEISRKEYLLELSDQIKAPHDPHFFEKFSSREVINLFP